MNTLPYELEVPCGIIVERAYINLGRPGFKELDDNNDTRAACRLACDYYIINNRPSNRALKTPESKKQWIYNCALELENIIIEYT